MSEDIFVCSYSEISHRHAILEDDGQTAWLYLHEPSPDPQRSGEVEADCFAYNRCQPIEVKDVQKYRPGPPPIAKGYASDRAVCRKPDVHEWRLIWSKNGESVVLMRDGDCWCFITPDSPRGHSKAIRAEGPWGSPWSDDLYERIEWNG